MEVHDKSLLNTVWNKLYQKSVIMDYRIEMSEELSLGEDLVFNLNYLDACGRQGFIIQNQILYNYVRNGKESLDNGYRDDYHYAVQRMYDAFYGFCEKRSIETNKVFWKWAMWMYDEVLCNTYSQSSRQSAWRRYRFNDRVMKDQRLAEIVKQIGRDNGVPAYVGYRSRSYAILLLMRYYERYKKIVKKRRNVDE